MIGTLHLFFYTVDDGLGDSDSLACFTYYTATHKTMHFL